MEGLDLEKLKEEAAQPKDGRKIAVPKRKTVEGQE